MADDFTPDFVLHDEDGEISDVNLIVLRNPVGQKYTWARDNSRMSMMYKCDWSRAADAKKLLLGKMEHVPLEADPLSLRYIHRTVPHSIPNPWPDDYGEPWYAQSVDVSPMVDRNQPDRPAMTQYEYAYLSVSYEGVGWDYLTDAEIIGTVYISPDESALRRWVEIAVKPSPRQILARSGSLRWAGTNRPVLQGTPLPLYEEDITIRWREVPYVNAPFSIMRSYMWTVNSFSFADRDPGTVMLQGAEYEEKWHHSGQKMTNIGYRFKYSRTGWNNFPDPTRNFNFFGVRKGDGNPVYTLNNFANLFRPVAAT